ncbi:hypothetical protein MRB53_039511 [Persea americana]|nr:hypothetical protein MRB53_039511 [Persea americana]
MRSQSRSANSPPVLVEGGDGIDGRQLLEEITLQYNSNYVDQPDFQERMMMRNYAVPRAPDLPRTAPDMNPRYSSSSMSPSYTASRSSSRSIPSQYSVQYRPRQYSISSRSSRTPSLTTQATISTRSDVSLDRRAEYIAEPGPIDDDGYVRSGNMPCDFDFLLCPERRPVGQQWHDHSRFHLGTATPPTQVSCPAVGCDWRRVYSDGEEAWRSRSDHIRDEHASPSDWSRGWRRPDQILIQHLWYNRIILPEEYRDLKVSGRIRSSSFSVSHGHRDDRSREPRHRPHRG